LNGRQYIVKTIVTTEMMARVAESFGLDYFDCLTGFKYIAEIIRENEETRKYVCGGEESFGFLPCDFVRDKDAVCSVAMAAEMAAWARENGVTVYQLLRGLYLKYGFYREGMVSVVRPGQEGQAEIARMMEQYRTAPPRSICGSPVVTVRDYLSGESLDVESGARTPIKMERSNVLQFLTADGTIVSVRPSGTEPKIKFYFGVREPLPTLDAFGEVERILDDKIARMKQELGL
jgi:phosphoglucomutase